VLHLGPHERLNGTGLRLQMAVPAAGSGSDEAGSVDDGEVGAVLVLHSDDDFFGGELAGVLLQPGIFSFDISLNLGKGFVVRERGVGIGDEVAGRGLALGVVFHVEGYGPAGLGAAANVVELKAHEGLHQGALAVRLVAHHQNRGGVEGSLQVLGQRVQLIVGFVQAPLPLLLFFLLRQLPLHFQITLPSSASLHTPNALRSFHTILFFHRFQP